MTINFRQQTTDPQTNKSAAAVPPVKLLPPRPTTDWVPSLRVQRTATLMIPQLSSLEVLAQ